MGQLAEYLCSGHLFHLQEKEKKEERMKPALTI